MGLIAEGLVEEWLNRKGYFTIRGARSGVHEADILALGHEDGELIARHIEVQVSTHPVSFLTPWPKSLHAIERRARNSSKLRTDEQMQTCVTEWVNGKFRSKGIVAMRDALAPGLWRCEAVIHRVKHAYELNLLRDQGVIVHQLSDIVAELEVKGKHVHSAANGETADLTKLGESTRPMGRR